jgi:LysR family transcriptional regulator, glycine cleavage system transcriptional activator
MAKQKLPPMSTLPVFEAAARLESFSAAAEELFVTHGAVSHQIKSLEAFVGTPLFIRDGRGVALTREGRLLAERVRSALDEVGNAVAIVTNRHRANRLTISVLPSFASRWLMPRIGGFMSEHPGWEVNVEAAAALADFNRDDVDVAIRFGRGNWPGMRTEWFMDDRYIMVASPKLNGGKLPKKPEKLAQYPLLRAEAEPWSVWCSAAGVDIPVPTTGLEFSDAGLNLQAVIEGKGITLARYSIAETELARGTLVALFNIDIDAGAAYYIVWPEQTTPTESMLAFRDWLFAEKERSLHP